MKSTLIIANILVFALFACQPTNNKQPETAPAQPALDEAAETEAIMKVIEKETKNFFDGDYEAWASNWSHQPYAMQAWNLSDGTSDAAIGWDSINAQGKMWIEKYYKNGENVIHPVVKKDKPIVKFFNEKTAYLLWKQYNADKEKKFYQVSQESRIMEKEADGWKIVNVSAFWYVDAPIPFDSLK